ncbi:phage tail tip lysozyme [Commensalibacter communis]|uniref:phage tail tip lysozyme n=1 Tax=Commensalibacter communis TaxID=2972786 RepID=UPI0022FF685F|nr:phage tail tip lysozyme [Commensalibacter communis]CAI3933333.1 unnamed protein product [Commensalibacter communis]CAI3944857.1 unnamed protein product [Commensalibacter communis]
MAVVDSNGPTFEVNVDTKKAKEELKNLDQETTKAFDAMDKRAASFGENLKKTFSDFKNGGGIFSQPSSNATNTNSSQNVAKENQELQYKAKMLELQQHAFRQRNIQVETGKQLLASSKSMVLAVASLAGAGLGAKAMLDFAHHMGKLQNFLDASNSNKTNALAYRNEFTKRNVDENSYWGAYQNVNDTLIKMQSGEAGKLPELQRWALSKLQRIDPSIQIGWNKEGRLNTDEQLKRIVNAGQQLQKRNPTMSHSQVVDLFQQATGGDINFAQAALKGRLDISKADLAKAEGQADALPANAKVDAAKQELATTFEAEQAKFIAAISPMAIDFIKGLNTFVGNYGQLAMATTALASFGGAVAGFLMTMRMAGSILPSLAGNAAKAAPKAGVGSALWRGTKWAGGHVWDGAKWVAGKGVDASEWVERNPKALVKGVGRLAGAVPMAAWDLTVGNITDAQSTSLWDAPSYDLNGKKSRAGRAKDIERSLNAKVGQFTWSNKYYVQTKDGVYVYIDSQFYEPIEQIKKRLDNGQIDIPNQPSTSITKSISEAILPSAHAGDLVSKQAMRSNNHFPFNELSQNKNMQEIYNYLTTSGGLTREQALGEMGSMKQESQFNPNALGDEGKAFGLYQWREKRQEQFKKLYGFDIHKSTLKQQLDFRTWEMNNTYKHAGDAIKRSKTAADAARAHTVLYEIPAQKELRAQQRIANIPSIRMSLDRSNNTLPRPTAGQIATQAQANRIHNETRNMTTNNGGNTTHHNNATVNIHVQNGTVDNVKKALDKGIKGFPSASNFNLRSGVS